jgi:hypothetical protein
MFCLLLSLFFVKKVVLSFSSRFMHWVLPLFDINQLINYGYKLRPIRGIMIWILLARYKKFIYMMIYEVIFGFFFSFFSGFRFSDSMHLVCRLSMFFLAMTMSWNSHTSLPFLGLYVPCLPCQFPTCLLSDFGWEFPRFSAWYI